MSIYEVFIDPIWTSIGAIATAIGVFIGAWLGTRMANRSRIKEQLKELENTKKAYLQILDDEIYSNKNLLEKMKGYLTKNPPIHSAFDALLAGSRHVKYNTWNNLVSSKVFHLLNHEQQIAYQFAHQTSRNISRDIDMEIAEWQRIYDFNKHYTNNPPEEIMQLGKLDDILQQRTHRLDEEVKKAITILSNVIVKIEENWEVGKSKQ